MSKLFSPVLGTIAVAVSAVGCLQAAMSLPSGWMVEQTTAQYTFEGNTTNEIPANKITGSELPGIYNLNNWTATEGTLIAPASGTYNGLYFGNNGNSALSLGTNWGVSMSAKVVQSSSYAGLLQFGEPIGALYIGAGSLGFRFNNGNMFSVSLGDSFSYGSFHDYAVSFVGSSLQIWLDGQDITGNLTAQGSYTWADAVASCSELEWTLKRIAYANNVNYIPSLPEGSVLDEVSVYRLQAVPEPATASLSLLGLMALMARRRRA